jgi:lysophospholipase L1-like esterase
VCGNETLSPSPTQRSVLLIGDSISMTPPFTPGGYGGALEALLAKSGVAVQHTGGNFAGGQAGDTRHGLVCTNATAPSYLAFEGKFDLIHFNFGLHDLANYSAELPPLPLPQYGANLVEIYTRLSAHTPRVMWTTTTPAPDVPTSYGRTYELVEEYNAEALRALTAVAPKLLVNDLFKAMIDSCGVRYKSCPLQVRIGDALPTLLPRARAPARRPLDAPFPPPAQLPANVHLTPEGIAFTAAAAARDILRALA